MLAAVVEKPGTLVVKEVDKPVIDDDQVLIKVHAGSICNATENHIYHGIFDGYHDHYPQILGHEVCGEIVEMGKNVTGLSIGNRIVMYTMHGAFCEYMAFNPSKERCAIVPDNLESRVATCCEMFDGAYVGMVGVTEIKDTDNVLFIGAGPMGLTSLACAKLYAGSVSVVDLYESRLEKAKEMGADYVYDRSKLSTDQVVEAIMKNTGPVDIVFMCIAEDRSKELDAFDMGVKALKYGGKMSGLVVAVKNIGDNHRINPFPMIAKNIRFQHVQDTSRSGSLLFQHAVNMVAEGKIPMEKLITHEFCLDQLPEALELCDKQLDKVIKVVIYPRLSK